MSRFHSYINSAKTIVEKYKGEKPFAIFIKQFFAANKKYGAKDRRLISTLCYNFFRLGFAGKGISSDQKMLEATFLCESEPSELMEKLNPEWNKKMTLPINEKLATLDPGFLIADIFPFSNELSDGIETGEFCKSFLVQPDLFLRIRPQTKTSVLKKLEKLKLSWQWAGDDCVRMRVSEKVDDFFIIDKEVVVQDYHSQKVLDYLRNGDVDTDAPQTKSKPDLSVWDCCAASGGKSILLNDIVNRKINLTVSDIRANIILNLHRRFKKAGIKEYKYFIADITSADFTPGGPCFDLIICDVPCSGSGTWSRTPEQMYFFKQPAIKEYSDLQKKIISSVMPHLQTGGMFIYITCSVFKNENEAISEFIAENFNCQLLQQQMLKGYDKKADSMFVAVFRKL
ncbi:MAG: Fmu (Sun) domain-containing protein [Ferruginibacter sp.]|nr:Fmu (Sun) domain-containing protein [Ferruginibacter sp.]